MKNVKVQSDYILFLSLENSGHSSLWEFYEFFLYIEQIRELMYLH